MNDEGLADIEAANPFRLPRLHPEIGFRTWRPRQRRRANYRPPGDSARQAILDPLRTPSYSRSANPIDVGVEGPAPMKCSRCQQENEAGALFCEECAAPLARACSNCGRQLSATAKFCPACAHPTGLAAMAPAAPRSSSPESYTPKYLAERILRSQATLEGERKQVTVLFVDVSGFTSLSSRLDPEDVHRIMQRAFELMLAEVHRFEGTVNQFLGDGIMALFGAPIAHEDHAQRAVHAALGIRRVLEEYRTELQQQRGVEFQARLGLNTGLVVVGSIGNDLRMDYTAVGDTTNVAARMQQAADPGRILVSEATHRLISGYFHARPLGALTLKGKAEPVPAWEIISARADRARIDVSEERGLTGYVGREHELAVLRECFERAKSGRGQVVFVVGEPGIGKSRLLYEFRRRLEDEATWLEGRCVSFGQSMPLHPIIDMLKRTFRIEEGDAPDEIGRKIDRAVLQLGEDLRPLLPYLRYLLSVDPGDAQVAGMDPQARRGEIFDALRRLLVRASEVRPQVFVHEDVHWMDKATEECLLFMADSVPTSRVLHVLTYRTGWRHPFGEHTYHTRLALGTLSSTESVGMARALLATAELPSDLQALITRKAEGNPFFIEEVVKSLHEVGALRREGDRYVLTRSPEGVVIPDTIQGIIMARIDRLADAPKKTLQLASVIGREFTRRLLDRDHTRRWAIGKTCTASWSSTTRKRRGVRSQSSCAGFNLGALLLVWPVLRPAGRYGSRFDTTDYVESWKTRGGAILLLLGFWLQAFGTYLGGGQR
jgi:class 3 adenylate cyclase